MSAQRARAKPIDELPPRQLAALAKALLMIDAARQYGLIVGGPEINVERCEAILERLAADGVEPTEDEALAGVVEVCHEIGVVR